MKLKCLVELIFAKMEIVDTIAAALTPEKAGVEFTPLQQLYRPEEQFDMVMDNYGKYHAQLDFSENGWQKTQPVWGLFTTPAFSPKMHTETFDYPHFTWETNVNFLHYGGSFTVPLRYDLSDEDLEALLDSVNGVFFGGGGSWSTMDWASEDSPMYGTAKRIWNYMKRQKDEKGIDFPIFGICQGFQLVHFLANDDSAETLSKVVIFGKSRKSKFAVENPKEYTLFDQFPDDVLRAFETENVALHSHSWVIKTETYSTRP